MPVGEFFEEVVMATTGPVDTGVRSFARETSEYVEQNAPAGPQSAGQPRGSGYSSPGRGVSGESVN